MREEDRKLKAEIETAILKACGYNRAEGLVDGVMVATKSKRELRELLQMDTGVFVSIISDIIDQLVAREVEKAIKKQVSIILDNAEVAYNADNILATFDKLVPIAVYIHEEQLKKFGYKWNGTDKLQKLRSKLKEGGE